MTRYPCSAPRRLLALQRAGSLSTLNGIEYIEVRDTDEPSRPLRQRTLYVRLVRPVPAGLGAGNVVIDGGERITEVAVEWAAAGDSTGAAVPGGLTQAEWDALLAGIADPGRVLVVRTAARGDFSLYRLRLVAAKGAAEPPAGFDPLLASAEFRFKAECDGDFDCAPHDDCPPEPHTAPAIDYLAKDYQGFRRLMLDRLSLLAPGWTERNPADAGVTLVEMLAYVADELSYRQDAVATEAYLGTARSRVSLRRHARLVDYRVHEGCNARTWVRFEVDGPSVVLPAHTPLLTRVPGARPRLRPDSAEHRAAMTARPEVFETVGTAVLHSGLKELRFHTWGDRGCCLPRGAVAATLRGHHRALRAGDVLVLAETVSPTTGRPADADPGKRWAVRLTDVRSSADPLGGLFETPQTPQPLPVTEIRWHEEDALPFPLCLSVVEGALETARAWGNIVLADHGRTVPDKGRENLGTVPGSRLVRVGGEGAGPVPARFRPGLAQGPLTHAVARPAAVAFETPATPALLAALNALVYDDALAAVLRAHDLDLSDQAAVVRGGDPLWSVGDGGTVVRLLLVEGGVLRVSVDVPPASGALEARPREALPAIRLEGTLAGVTDPWTPEYDLLASAGSARAFTVESEHDGSARLRFGDGEHGLRPAEGTRFRAVYRVGSGLAGNIGADALAHAVTPVSAVTKVHNPLPAAGGADPESAEEVRRDAPQAFAVQERAVTEEDYAEAAARGGGVQRAAATFRWTGSWHTVFVTADRFGGRPVDAQFETALRGRLERYRMAGYDLEVDGPRFVPLEIGLRVCAGRAHLRSDVAEEVLAVLGDAVLPDGRRGLFHPDNFTFGRPVHLSAVYAAVHSVPGVDSADVHTFQRQHQPETSALDTGVLTVGRLEIARLDNDPDFPERGVLDLTLGGGR